MRRAGSLPTAAILVAAVLWGTTGTVAHQAPAHATQALIGLSTFGFGGVLLVALDLSSVIRLLRQRWSWRILPLGSCGVLMYAFFYYWSMSLVGVAIGNALALGSGPVFAALLEVTIDRRPVRARWVTAIG